jgi:hypothetical protein
VDRKVDGGGGEWGLKSEQERDGASLMSGPENEGQA